ncbi:MAG TPA: radical SAM protein [Nocardioides sp.]|uniref:radical SAM/SPASM domain-containing protein n=1 Tax=Nocardioides sp. TaxID=35761 RepID=UPI002F4079B3
MTAVEVEHYIASKYLSLSHLDDGSMVVHCSRTGATGIVEQANVDTARKALRRGAVSEGPLEGILADLRDGGFLIPSEYSEDEAVHKKYIGRYTDNALHLIVMPTEQCNFRCVYCYEKFIRGQMSAEMEDALVRFVQSHDDLRHLTLSWFGGEPLLAWELIGRVTGVLRTWCEERGATYLFSATTNGSLLTPEVAEVIVGAGVTNYQITLDGLHDQHDAHRPGINGESTFETIVGNLRNLRDSNYPLQVAIRHNFDKQGMDSLPDFLTFLADEFGNDPRFAVELEAVGRWGGANDDALPVLEGKSLAQAHVKGRELLSQYGLHDVMGVSAFQPDGFVCYAANPRSFVIGPDGSVYKCTVELDYHDRNIVGKLEPDGTMTLDWQKMALWCETDGMRGIGYAADATSKCQTCYFSPACHGAICPKEWMDEPECQCPPQKHTIGRSLELIAAESLFASPYRGPVATCPKG